VLVTGYELGVNHDGGFSGIVRVPADWVVPIPDGLDAFSAMAIGTAGFTAGLAVSDMERNGLAPASGPVIVTGATGGVGSVAVACLAALGYRVTALTGKADAADYLRALGATEILDRATLQMGTRPLERATWAGAVDAAGGDTLAWLLRTGAYGAAIAATGLAGGTELHVTVLPFILRGVKLLGIDSVMCPMPARVDVWTRLARLLSRSHVDLIAHGIGLADVPAACEALLAGGARGRFVVNTGIYTSETIDFRP
jgi:NADPH2:quinone reductase